MLHRATEAAEPNKDHYTVYQYISNCSPKCWSLSLTSRRMLIGARSLALQSRTTYICRRVFFIWSNLLMLLRTCPCNSFFSHLHACTCLHVCRNQCICPLKKIKIKLLQKKMSEHNPLLVCIHLAHVGNLVISA